ncbi:MAG: hypothetical protein GX684_03645 [Ruminococcaceae bacterium]|nr:hypothetical protein [Oscillospiraceae bacterium]
MFFYIFRFPGAILKDERFLGKKRPRNQPVKGRKRQALFYLLLTIITTILFIALISVVTILLIWLRTRAAGGVDENKILFALLYTKFMAIGSVAIGIFASLSLCSIVVTLYHKFAGDVRPAKTKEKATRRVIIARIATPIIALLLLGFFAETEYVSKFFPSEIKTQVVAHRAGAIFAPENTISAINRSVQDGANMAEVDVQQLKDGTLIVMHDSDFKRTTGKSLKVWDATYEDVKNLDAGSFFSEEFKNEKIPTLKEMLAASKDKIKLMIELKATGREKNLVEKTIAEIKEAGMEKQCTIASMSLVLLQESKQIAPEIETVYITAMMFSGLYTMQFVDGYSVETSFLSENIIVQAHADNKKVYVWTANTDENMKKIVRFGADGIVTDNAKLANFVLKFGTRDFLLEDLTELLFPAKK